MPDTPTEITIGPFTFEYLPEAHAFGVARGEDLFASGELFHPEDWQQFVAEAEKIAMYDDLCR